MNYLIGFCVSEQGISPEAMQEKLKELQPMVRSNPNVRSVLNVAGYPQRNQGFTIAFLNDRPPRKVTAQKVTHIRFDQAGNVAAIENTDEKLIASIRPNGDRTPTLGRKKSFFEDLFGGIGTISQPGLPGSGGQ